MSGRRSRIVCLRMMRLSLTRSLIGAWRAVVPLLTMSVVIFASVLTVMVNLFPLLYLVDLQPVLSLVGLIVIGPDGVIGLPIRLIKLQVILVEELIVDIGIVLWSIVKRYSIMIRMVGLSALPSVILIALVQGGNDEKETAY